MTVINQRRANICNMDEKEDNCRGKVWTKERGLESSAQMRELDWNKHKNKYFTVKKIFNIYLQHLEAGDNSEIFKNQDFRRGIIICKDWISTK